MPEPPIDPPDEDDGPECPVCCDAILIVSSRDLASCEVCGFTDEPDWSMQDDQAD